MRAVVMIIRRVRGKKPLQMARVQGDDVVEQIAAAAPHPTLGHSILPRTRNRGLHARDLQGAKRSGLWVPKTLSSEFSTHCHIPIAL
jgi:hypothetical protein